MRDVVIIGGGPAGLHAGARLAAAGFDVALIEEHESVGEPVHCTGVLAADAFEEFGLSRRALLNELRTARFRSPSGKEVVYAGSSVEAVVVDRRMLDQDLLESARNAGVTVVRGSRVTHLQIDDTAAAVRAGDEVIRARVCLLACGANYSLHRQIGLGMPQLFLHTAQIEVPAGKPGDVELYFGNAIAPKGFGWAVPVIRGPRTYARVGVMCEQDAAQYFDQIVADVAQRWEIAAPESLKPRQKMLPLAPIPRTYADRLVAIGDAAGLVKPTTGGGIYYSLMSADIAATVVADALRAGDVRAARLAPYEREWQARLSDELQAQVSMRTAAERMTDQDIEDLFELALTDGVMPIVRRTASFNRHRKLILALLQHPPVRQLLLRRLAF